MLFLSTMNPTCHFRQGLKKKMSHVLCYHQCSIAITKKSRVHKMLLKLIKHGCIIFESSRRDRYSPIPAQAGKRAKRL